MSRLALTFQGTSYGRTVEQTHGVTHISRDTEEPPEKCRLLSNGVEANDTQKQNVNDTQDPCSLMC
jgi:hypothetical protein